METGYKTDQEYGNWWLLYISSEEEVKEWDSQTGGETRVVVINSKGLKAFPPDELKIYV